MDGHRPKAKVAQAALSDSQLDRDIESAVGIEPSAEFLARVRTRIAAEPEPSAWRLSFEPMWGVAIAGSCWPSSCPSSDRSRMQRASLS